MKTLLLIVVGLLACTVLSATEQNTLMLPSDPYLALNLDTTYAISKLDRKDGKDSVGYMLTAKDDLSNVVISIGNDSHLNSEKQILKLKKDIKVAKRKTTVLKQNVEWLSYEMNEYYYSSTFLRTKNRKGENKWVAIDLVAATDARRQSLQKCLEEMAVPAAAQ